jgi:succinate dehydrogenase / fumarate reductase, flavoprotein subunit
VGAEEPGRQAPPEQIPEAERDYYLERRYPSFGNLVPRDVASRAAKAVCDEGRGVGETGWRCTSTSPTRSSGWART